MSIEKLLTTKYAKDHSMRHHGILGIFREMSSDEKKLKEQFKNYADSTNNFRNELAQALGTNPDECKRAAEDWSCFIKTKVPVFKFWSTLCTAFISIYALGSALFTLVGTATGVVPPLYVLLFFLLVSVILLVTKYYVDKRVFWYEYVLANLDVIAKLSQAAPPLDIPTQQADAQAPLLSTAPSPALQVPLCEKAAQHP